MKHIGIDARLLFQTGVGTYLQNLLHYLPLYAQKDITFTIYCLPSDVEFIKKEVPNARIHATEARWHTMSEQTAFLDLINKDTLDLMHFTYFGHPLLYRRRSISTVHDVTPLIFKTGKASTKNPLIYLFKHMVFSHVLKNQVFHSEAIITPTITVKEQLQSIYGESISSKITPIYEGVSYRLLEASKTNSPKTIKEPYLLYVGNFYPHKNVEFLIRAFVKSNSSHHLVLAGPRDYFLNKILDTLSESEKRRIIIKDKQTLSELTSLYKNAEALIHPSISEGFGLPIVEAMCFNLPIIASHIPVFQELLGTSHYSFDPFDEQSVINAIHLFEKDSEKKINHLRPDFSFTQMAKKTMELYCKHV